MTTQGDVEVIVREVAVAQETIAADIDDFMEETVLDDADGGGGGGGGGYCSYFAIFCISTP